MPSEAPKGAGVSTAAAVAQRYLGACEDTRKAWYNTSMLSRARPQQIRQIRQVLAGGDPSSISQALLDMSGPMHPGDPSRARDPMTASGAALARCVVQAVLEAVLSGTSAQRGPTSASTSPPALDAAQQVAFLEELKRQLVFWIEHGKLDGPELDRGFKEPGLIAQFLRGQSPDLDAPAQAALRLACVAMTAPALEAAWVIARLSDGFLSARDAAFGVFDKDPSGPKGPSGSTGPHPNPNAAHAAMSRDAQDDLDEQMAFEAVSRTGRPTT
jgi:hypothetical protein